MLKPLEIPPLTAEELEALEKLYRTTKEVRLRTRAQIVLLAGEHGSVSRAVTSSGPASASQPGTTLFDVDLAALVRLHGRANRHPGLL